MSVNVVAICKTTASHRIYEKYMSNWNAPITELHYLNYTFLYSLEEPRNAELLHFKQHIYCHLPL